MSHDQRYVSKELTHFVGRSLRPDEDAQYELLKTILGEGRLTGIAGMAAGMGRSMSIMALHKRISDNEMYTINSLVCFCDIPVGDLQLHMEKYGRFGVSFVKDFLAEQGASPLFYVSRSSQCQFRLKGMRHRSEMFDFMTTELAKLSMQLLDILSAKSANGEEAELERKLVAVLYFLELEVMNYLKFFDHNLDDDHEHNYYMEREWRTLQDVHFASDDVYRVILPQKYTRQFRKDYPDYTGQITFSD